MPKKDHIHLFKRYKKRSGKPQTTWWFLCSDPDCNFVSDYDQTLGKRTRCHSCGSEFILDKESIKRIEPRCLNCSEHKKARIHQRAATVLAEILPNVDEIEIEPEEEPWL